MDKTIYIFTSYLEYGTPSCNRFLAYAKGIRQLGYNVKIVAYGKAVLHDLKGSDDCEIIVLPAGKISNRFIRLIAAKICLLTYLLCRVERQARILLYGGGDALPIFLLTGRRNLYHEMTESPEINPPILLSLKQYFRLCRKLKGLFVISRPLKELYKAQGVKEERIRIINMIVDSTRFENADCAQASPPYIAYCGLVTKGKDGVPVLLKSFAEFHRHIPEYRLKIIGPMGRDVTLSSLSEMLPEEARDFVEFTGLVSPQVMPGLLSNARMLILTRPNNKQALYGFPTKLGEYLATKRPVIVTNVGDIGAFLRDKQNALVVKPDDLQEITDAMLWVVQHPQEAAIIGQRGAECANEHFSYLIESRKIIEAFEQV